MGPSLPKVEKLHDISCNPSCAVHPQLIYNSVGLLLRDQMNGMRVLLGIEALTLLFCGEPLNLSVLEPISFIALLEYGRIFGGNRCASSRRKAEMITRQLIWFPFLLSPTRTITPLLSLGLFCFQLRSIPRAVLIETKMPQI